MRRLAPILLFLTAQMQAQQDDDAVVHLRETISRIIDVQTLESQERLGWEARKAEMGALLELHRKELELLEAELASAGNSAPAHEGAAESLKKEIEDLRKSRRLVSDAVARNVPGAIRISGSLPLPLLAEVEPELATLRTWTPSAEPREALRSILSLVGKAQQFNRRFTRSTQVIGSREADVLYLGLGCAFYADRKDSAGIGRPAAGGWKWEERPGLLPRIRSALEMLDKKGPPAVVELPLRIE